MGDRNQISPDGKSQHDRFIETARSIGADEE